MTGPSFNGRMAQWHCAYRGSIPLGSTNLVNQNKKYMKKILCILASIGIAASLFVGCSTVKNLTPAQIATVATVITQTADTGAVYAIQKDPRNAQYFKLANATLDTFVLGNDLSPVALQDALSKVTSTNQWVNLAISGVVVAYDLALSKYISGSISNNPAAATWILAIETGFKQALASTGTGLTAVHSTVPYFIKDGKVDKAAIEAKLNKK